MRRGHSDPEALAAELAALDALSAEMLRRRWRALFGHPPPARLRRKLLLAAIAYRLQENALGGLKASTCRILDRAAADAAAGRDIAVPAQPIKSGTRLLREWHGDTHEVILLDDGVLYQGQRFRSLSEVARTITGVRWSGPAFFGTKPRKEPHHDRS
jgi:hypothetical protein